MQLLAALPPPCLSQVVGRIHTGREVLEQLNAMPTSSLDDSPLTSVTITRCGTCSPDGTYDSFDDAVRLCPSSRLPDPTPLPVSVGMGLPLGSTVPVIPLSCCRGHPGFFSWLPGISAWIACISRPPSSVACW